MISQVVWRGEKECAEVRQVVFALSNFNDDGDSSRRQQRLPVPAIPSLPLAAQTSNPHDSKKKLDGGGGGGGSGWGTGGGGGVEVFHTPINDKNYTSHRSTSVF